MRTTDNLGLKITEGNDDWRDIFDDNADNMETLDGLADVIAPQYDPEDSYFAGDYCMYQGKTYQALVDVDEEAWTAAHWQEVAIMDEIHNANFRGDQMDEGLAYVAVKSGNNWQLPSGKNAVAGDYIILYGALGRAKSAITGGTTNITSSNWESVSNGALNEQNDAIKSLEGSIAHIVGNTNSTGASLAVGDYVYVTGHSTIADGLRKVTSVIASGVSITTSNTSEVSGGIGSEVASLNSNITDLFYTKELTITPATTTNTHSINNADILPSGKSMTDVASYCLYESGSQDRLIITNSGGKFHIVKLNGNYDGTYYVKIKIIFKY